MEDVAYVMAWNETEKTTYDHEKPWTTAKNPKISRKITNCQEESWIIMERHELPRRTMNWYDKP